MCKISSTLKLCTCATKDPYSLKNYWILQRPHSRDEMILGETVLPHFLADGVDQFNQDTLLILLNEGNCFDVILDHREKDTLELHLSCKEKNLVYAFDFKNGKWKLSEYDPFANHDEVKHGKVGRAFTA
ncbi:hypothetical protein [Daejeonella sp.]|uniref:hypothetical protein n=1 Tax=Daejeonella sp. TaxID=2805397 RepID=UPI0030BFEB47